MLIAQQQGAVAQPLGVGVMASRPLNSTGRRLQIVLVLDRKTQKYLRVREMAFNDIQSVTSMLNVNLQVGLPRRAIDALID